MKIAFLGYGIEAESAYKYFAKKYPDADFVVYENKSSTKNVLPDDVEFHGGVESFKNIDADIVVRTPAINPQKITTRGKVTSVTKLFFENCPAPIIGVTGTKGKGTTASLIASILSAAGKTVHLLGNIGQPSLDVLDSIQPEDIVVYELSSFQLWDMGKSPHVAVVLMIEPEHLDVHSGLNDYTQAKSNITRFQSADDSVIYYAKNKNSQNIAELSHGEKIPYPNESHAYVKEGFFYYRQHKLCPSSALVLPGNHNLENACAAISATWNWNKDETAIQKGLSSFKGLTHRLKFIASKKGIDYYDDSIATTPGSTIAAIKSFDQPKVLILGGSSKGADFNDLAKQITKQLMRKVLLIGDEAKNIKQALDKVEFKNYEVLQNVDMSQIIKRASGIAVSGDKVILSPACASFDMFKNYQVRGEQFAAEVEKLDSQ